MELDRLLDVLEEGEAQQVAQRAVWLSRTRVLTVGIVLLLAPALVWMGTRAPDLLGGAFPPRSGAGDKVATVEDRQPAVGHTEPSSTPSGGNARIMVHQAPEPVAGAVDRIAEIIEETRQASMTAADREAVPRLSSAPALFSDEDAEPPTQDLVASDVVIDSRAGPGESLAAQALVAPRVAKEIGRPSEPAAVERIALNELARLQQPPIPRPSVAGIAARSSESVAVGPTVPLAATPLLQPVVVNPTTIGTIASRLQPTAYRVTGPRAVEPGRRVRPQRQASPLVAGRLSPVNLLNPAAVGWRLPGSEALIALDEPPQIDPATTPAILTASSATMIQSGRPANPERERRAPMVIVPGAAPSQIDEQSDFADLISTAQAGDPQAQYALSVRYASEGTARREADAVAWCRKAAEAGLAEAQYTLSLLYDEGRGVRQNSRVALRWLRQAARQGYATAQFRLGILYGRGAGVERDYDQALEWLDRAAAQGDARAAASRDLIARHVNMSAFEPLRHPIPRIKPR